MIMNRTVNMLFKRIEAHHDKMVADAKVNNYDAVSPELIQDLELFIAMAADAIINLEAVTAPTAVVTVRDAESNVDETPPTSGGQYV